MPEPAAGPPEAFRAEGVCYWDQAQRAAGFPGIGCQLLFATEVEALANAAAHGCKVTRVLLSPVKDYAVDAPEVKG